MNLEDINAVAQKLSLHLAGPIYVYAYGSAAQVRYFFTWDASKLSNPCRDGWTRTLVHTWTDGENNECPSH